MVGFRDFDGVGIAPVSNKMAVKGISFTNVNRGWVGWSMMGKIL